MAFDNFFISNKNKNQEPDSLNFSRSNVGTVLGGETEKLILPYHLPEIVENKESDKKEELKVTTLPTSTALTKSSTSIGSAVFLSGLGYSSETELKNIFADIEKAGFQTIFFQVRDVADAYYNSSFEPWSKRLSGTLGKDPGWDPLNVAIKESKKRNLKIYAWINVYTIWKGESSPGSKKHLYRTHQDWIAYEKDAGKMKLNPGYIYLSPGNYSVTNYLNKIILDVSTRYQIDGVYLDKLQFPTRYYSYDPVALDRFRKQYSLSWDEWRIDQINSLLKKVNSSLEQRKPKIKIIAQTYGRYQKGKEDFAQDPVSWIDNGLVDYVCPLVEWDTKDYPYFNLQIEDFKNRISGSKLCIGISAYKFAANFAELSNQVEIIKKYKLENFSFYTFRHLKNRLDGIKGLIFN